MADKNISWKDLNEMVNSVQDEKLYNALVSLQDAALTMYPNNEQAAINAFKRAIKLQSMSNSIYNDPGVNGTEWVPLFDLTYRPNYPAIDDMAEAFGFENGDMLSAHASEIDPETFKAVASAKWPDIRYEDMRAYLDKAAQQRQRELKWEGYSPEGKVEWFPNFDEGRPGYLISSAMGLFTPRSKEAYLAGREPTLSETVMDVGESALSAVPGSTIAKAGLKVATSAPKAIGKGVQVVTKAAAKKPKWVDPTIERGAFINSPVFTHTADAAMVPTITAVGDYLTNDDPTSTHNGAGNNAERAISGAITNAATPAMLRQFVSRPMRYLSKGAVKKSGMENMGRNIQREIDDGVARRTGIMVQEPSDAMASTAIGTSAMPPTTSEWKTAMKDQSIHDYMSGPNTLRTQFTAANGKPMEYQFDADAFGLLDENTPVLKSTYGKHAGGKKPQMIEGTPSQEQLNKVFGTAWLNDPAMMTMYRRTTGQSQPLSEMAATAAGTYLGNQLGPRLYAQNRTVQGLVPSLFDYESPTEQKDAQKTVETEMTVPESHKAIFLKNPAGYLNWLDGKHSSLSKENQDYLQEHVQDFMFIGGK